MSDRWEEKNWDWALERIARLVKDTRDKGFVEKNSKGEIVNRCESIAHLGSSNVDNEECWLMSVSCRSMGLIYIDHQARV
jgi:formate dehydrogenase major subunit